MKIIRVNTTPISTQETKEWSRYGMEISHFAPSALSAFTAMKLARHFKKETPHVVMVDCLKNAMAAISARQLYQSASFKIVCTVPPNSEIPKSIPGDIKNGVDTWIFASQRLLDAYPADLKHKVMVMPVNLNDTSIERTSANPTPIISWIGDIRLSDTLKKAIDEADIHEGKFILRIAGAGRAAIVMPLVRMTRAMRYPQAVEWVGEDYSLEEELKKCSCILRTSEDITLTETIALQHSIPLIDTIEIKSFVDGSLQPTSIDASKEHFLSEMKKSLL